jgi:hypothetical protein
MLGSGEVGWSNYGNSIPMPRDSGRFRTEANSRIF